MLKFLKEKIPKWIYWIGIIGTFVTFAGTYSKKISNVTDSLRETRGFSEVLCGLLMAEMEPIDSNNYFVHYNGDKITVKLRKAKSGDIYTFVLDGKMYVYASYYNNSEQKYSFTDFGGKYRLIYKE